MKQEILNQIKYESKFLMFAERIQDKVDYWLGFRALNPIEYLTVYFQYISRMGFTFTCKKTKDNPFKIKIIKEPLGGKNPFDLVNIKHCYKKERKHECLKN